MSWHPVFARIQQWRAEQKNDINTLAWLHAELAHQVRDSAETDQETETP